MLNIKNAFAFDVQGVCSGFLYALCVANSLIKTNSAKNILVIGSDRMSKILDWEDRSTCVLFGDGAGAVILSAETKKKAIIDFHIKNRWCFRENFIHKRWHRFNSNSRTCNHEW